MVILISEIRKGFALSGNNLGLIFVDKVHVRLQKTLIHWGFTVDSKLRHKWQELKNNLVLKSYHYDMRRLNKRSG